MSPEPSLCTMKEFARHFGASFRTIRYYEQLGLLRPERVRRNRFFSEDDYRRMRFVEATKALGLTLSEIGELLNTLGDAVLPQEVRLPPALISERVSALERQRADLDGKLARLKAAQRRCTAEATRSAENRQTPT